MMPVSRFLVVAVPSLIGACACLALAAVLDAPLLAVTGVGFLSLAAAARWWWVGDDPVMAGLIVAFFVAAVVAGVINAV